MLTACASCIPWGAPTASSPVTVRFQGGNRGYTPHLSWFWVRIKTSIAGTANHTCANPGTHTVLVCGGLKTISLDGPPDAANLVSIDRRIRTNLRIILPGIYHTAMPPRSFFMWHAFWTYQLRLENIVIGAKFGSADAEEAARNVARTFIQRGCQVYVLSPIQAKGATQIELLKDLKDTKPDLAITLGGDGTTLRTLRYLSDETPVLTINVGGNRGILSEITLDQLPQAISQMESGNIILEKRLRVVASYAGEEFPPALNEIYITRTNLTRTAKMMIKFQNDTVTHKMDGVMISTPSGSTGHSFSLGGPILHESLNVLIITPVAPMFRLSPIVVPDDIIQIIPSHDCNIVMDAQVVKSAGFNEIITIKKYDKRAVFVRLKKRGLRQMSKMGF